MAARQGLAWCNVHLVTPNLPRGGQMLVPNWLYRLEGGTPRPVRGAHTTATAPPIALAAATMPGILLLGTPVCTDLYILINSDGGGGDDTPCRMV